MPSTVTLYTTALEELETLNIDHAEIDTTLHPQQTMREISVRTNFPYDLQALRNQENLIALARLNLEGERVEEVCRIDYVEWTYRHSIRTGSQGTSYTQLELTPLHSDAQQIIKAVLDKQEQEKRSTTVNYDTAYQTAACNIQETMRRMRRRDIAGSYRTR